LWLQHNVVPGYDKPVEEIQCLHALREGQDEVSGEVGQSIYLELDPIPETAKSQFHIHHLLHAAAYLERKDHVAHLIAQSIPYCKDPYVDSFN
jgi:hypothetical protein